MNQGQTAKDYCLSFIKKVWPAILIGSMWLWLFWPMLLGQTVCGFRDSAYLYYPLFKWIDLQWMSGDIPLWNHFDQFGIPVVADGTSSVFYPGKLIFFLRFLSFESRYGIFLASHVLIAASTCYWFARRLGCKQGGATMAAIGYAFSGSVLFQVCNVVFLIGAAWLPAALGSVWLMLKRRSWAWAAIGGFFCSLILLGGDPQLVFHIGLIGLATILGSRFSPRFRRELIKRKKLSPYSIYTGNLYRLMTLTIVTAILGAVQVLPSFEWSQDSTRASFWNPRSLYEWAYWSGIEFSDGRERVMDGLFGRPIDHQHIGHVYQFSQPPWSIAELFFPNFSGKAFPVNERWADALPGSDRMWVPSLYCGCLIGTLGLFSIRLWGKRRRQVWLSRVGLYFALGAMGWYGVIWLVREMFGTTVVSSDIGPQVGGLYWMMVVLIPKYVLFRYPAKLFLIAALALCLLTGLGVDKWRQKNPLLQLSLFGLPLVTTTAWLCVSNSDIWSGVPASALFGPFVSGDATQSAYVSMAHLLVVCLVAGIAFRFLKARHRELRFVLCLVLAIDVMLANAWMTAQVDSKQFTSEVDRRSKKISAVESRYPATWARETSTERLGQIVNWQRRAVFPKHHLNIPSRNELSFSTIERDPHAAVRKAFSVPFACLTKGHAEATLHPLRWSRKYVGGKVSIAEQRNGYYRFEVEATEDSFLCMQTLNVSGWQAIVQVDETKAECKIVPWLDSLQAVSVSQGRSVVEMRYRPRPFFVGAWISGVGWCILLVCFISTFFKIRKSGNDGQV